MSLTYYNKLAGWKYTPETIDTSPNLPETKIVSWQEPIWQNVGIGTQNDWRVVYVTNSKTVLDEYNIKTKKDKEASNKLKAAKNTFYSKIYTNDQEPGIVNSTKGNVYKFLDAKKQITQLKSILTDGGMSDADATKEIERMVGETGQFTNFYSIERMKDQQWNPSVLPDILSDVVKQRTDLGSNFNTYADGRKGYYLNETTTGQNAGAIWDQAEANNDLDILERYGSKETYAKHDYLLQITDPTKTSSQINLIRGSQSAALSPLVTDYTEKVFPGQSDAQAQMVRDEVQNKIFGLQQVTAAGQTGYQFRDVPQELSNFVTKNTAAQKLWNSAQSDAALAKLGTNIQGPWTKLTKSLGVKDSMLTDQTSFGSLLARVSILIANDPKDKEIIDANKTLIDSIVKLNDNKTFKDLTNYAPEVNDAFTNSVQASEAAQTTQFGQMRAGILENATLFK
jgi:hypothetical protein